MHFVVYTILVLYIQRYGSLENTLSEDMLFWNYSNTSRNEYYYIYYTSINLVCTVPI